MDISDLIFDLRTPLAVKQGVLEILQSNSVSDHYLPVLIPTESNDDINGSQHAAGGGTDFTYRDATEEEVRNASSLGYYKYFSKTYGDYTGHYYDGSDDKFDAIVIDPPAYAVEVTI